MNTDHWKQPGEAQGQVQASKAQMPPRARVWRLKKGGRNPAQGCGVRESSGCQAPGWATELLEVRPTQQARSLRGLCPALLEKLQRSQLSLPEGGASSPLCWAKVWYAGLLSENVLCCTQYGWVRVGWECGAG